MSRQHTKFNHLESNKASRETTWTDNLYVNGLPKRAFTNPVTSMFILMLQDYAKPIFQKIDHIKNWWRV